LNDILIDSGLSETIYFQTPDHDFRDSSVMAVGGIAGLMTFGPWRTQGAVDLIGYDDNWTRVVVVPQTP